MKYYDLDDLWCEWGDATSAIMNHIKENEPIESSRGWLFEEAMITDKRNDSYSLYIAHTAFDDNAGVITKLHVQAFASSDGKIVVQTNKREVVE